MNTRATYAINENLSSSDLRWYCRFFQSIYRKRKLVASICGVITIPIIIMCTTVLPRISKEVEAPGVEANRTHINHSVSLTAEGIWTNYIIKGLMYF